MKQLFATGAPTGPTVKATSAGLRPDELQAALGLTAYAPPADREPDAPLPVRLALLNTATAGRVLTHVAPREGGYFAHALLNVPGTADAQSVIQTWGSPQWQRHDPDSAGDLPELPYLPVADVLDDDSLRAWLADPQSRDLLEFVLTALLGTPADVRIFVAAKADAVAKIVYAITRVLPTDLLDSFTFSTYEPEPLSCVARLVGNEPGRDLPDACYAEPNCAYNPATGRKSEILFAVPFAAFAVGALADGAFSNLDEVKAAWHRLGLKDARKFDLVFRLSRGTGTMDKEEAGEALQLPAVAAWISSRSDALKQFLDWALDDREFATRSFNRAVQALRQKPEMVAKLAQTVRDEGMKALKAGDTDRTATALEVVLPMAAPAKANAVWGELSAQLTEPAELPWNVRAYLLPRFVRFRQQNKTPLDTGFAKWLTVPAARLGDLLALDLPRGYQLAAARATLALPDEPTAALAKTLAAHPKLTLTLLAPAGADAIEADRTVRLFEQLLADVSPANWFEDVLANAETYPPELLNRFFESALTAGKVDADRVVRASGPKLLDLFAGKSGLDRFGKLLLAAPPTDLLHNRGLVDFVRRLRADDGPTDELKARIDAVLAIRSYLVAPSFSPDAMTPTAAALAMTPPAVPPATKGEVFDAVATELRKREGAATLQADLEAALVYMGGAIANDPADLYENLLRATRLKMDVGRSANLSTAFLAVALGAANHEKLAGKLDGLDGHAFAVASDAAKRGKHKLLDELDRRSASWPKDARTKWGFLLTAVRPSSRLVRDLLCFVLGAAVSAAAVYVALKA